MTILEYTINRLKEQNIDVFKITGNICTVAYYAKHGETCGYAPCGKCAFYDDRDAVEYLLAEHKE